MAKSVYDAIAAKLECSPRTVRRVLRGEGKGVRSDHAARAAKIRALAEKMNYRPNRAASSVRTGRFGAVALVAGRTGGSYIPYAMLAGIEDRLAERKVNLMFARLGAERLTSPEALPTVLQEHAVDGLLINHSNREIAEVEEELTAILKRFAIPAVWVNGPLKRDCVTPDDRGAARRGTEHLLRLGHARVAFLDVSETDHHSKAERKRGYRTAMKKAGRPARVVDDVRMPWVRTSEDRARLVEHLERLLRASNRPTAIVACDVRDATPLLLVAERLGLRAPRDLSVLTFDHSANVDIDLNTIGIMRIPFGEVGRAAADAVLERVESPGSSFPTKRIPLEGVVGHLAQPASRRRRP